MNIDFSLYSKNSVGLFMNQNGKITVKTAEEGKNRFMRFMIDHSAFFNKYRLDQFDFLVKVMYSVDEYKLVSTCDIEYDWEHDRFILYHRPFHLKYRFDEGVKYGFNCRLEEGENAGITYYKYEDGSYMLEKVREYCDELEGLVETRKKYMAKIKKLWNVMTIDIRKKEDDSIWF